MFRGLVICTVACASAIPALAGDKPARVSPAAAVALTSAPAAYRSSGPSKAAGPFTLPLAQVRAKGADVIRLSDSAMPKPRRFDYADAAALPDWRITDDTAERTAAAGGRYAVGDTLSSQRKPRFRRSALGALLVFKIDGQDDSPPLSVGGGGLAAAMWRAVPK